MPSAKKFGGVKQTRQGETSAANAADAPPRRVGGITASARAGSVQSCPQNCPGEYIGAMWVHSRDCPWVAVLWKAHGVTTKKALAVHWRCPYDCNPVELPSAWTHPFYCPFWDHTGQTPFDEQPPRDVPIVSGMESALLGQSKKRK